MMYFNTEEQNLIGLYMPKENRVQLIKAIIKDEPNREDTKQMKELVDDVVDKLAKISDMEYKNLVFSVAE